MSSQGSTIASRDMVASPVAAGCNKPPASVRPGEVKVSSITVANPTAAEHTMQPANINENSRRSLAACISCRAQATSNTTAATIRSATPVAWGAERVSTTGNGAEKRNREL